MLPISLRLKSDLPSSSKKCKGKYFLGSKELIKNKPQSLCCHQLALVNQCTDFFLPEWMDFIKCVLTVLFSLIIFGFYGFSLKFCSSQDGDC